MNHFATLLSSLLRVGSIAAIALPLASIAIQQESTAQSQPVVVRARTLKGGQQIPIDWRVPPSKKHDFHRYYVPNDPSLEGARIFQAMSRSNNLTEVLEKALAFDGFESISILGKVPLKNVGIFDRGGKGEAMAGTAILNGNRYRFTAVGLYMTFSSNPRVITHSVFAAPEDISVRLGGFLPISSTYFDLDGSKVKDLILQAGRMSPADQAKQLANATDTYFSKAGQAISSSKSRRIAPGYPGGLFNDGMCTGVSGTDPDAYGVTGLDNPDC